MQIILLERVERLGHMGEVVTVKPGYARNFLLPKKKALRATKNNISYFEAQKMQFEAANLKRKEEAGFVAKKIEGLMITMIRQSSEIGHLYGSIRPQDVVDGLKAEGFNVLRTQIAINPPIKTLGIHEVKIILHPEVLASIKINIAKSEEEAIVQAKALKGESLKSESAKNEEAVPSEEVAV